MPSKVLHLFSSGVSDGVDTSLVLPSDWNLNHVIAEEMTNRTGGTLTIGDVVTFSTSNDDSVIAGDTASSLRPYVVLLGKRSGRTLVNASNLDVAWFARSGVVTCKNQGAVTRGNYVVKSSTAYAVQDSGTAYTSAPPAGALGVAVASAGGSGTMLIYLFGATFPGSTAVGGSGSPGAQYFEFAEMTAPSTPSANNVRLYVPTTSYMPRLEGKDPTGTVHEYVAVIARDATWQTVASTTTETTVFSTTIKGGALSTNRAFRITLLGVVTNTTGSSKTTTMRFKYGGTTFATCVPTIADGQSNALYQGIGVVANSNATNDQVGHAIVRGANDTDGSALHTLAIDSTADQTLEVTVQHSASSASLSYTMEYALVELL
jgi:hypothetical protein